MPDLPTRAEVEESQRICERFDRYEPEEFDSHARTALPRLNAAYLALLARLAEKDAEIERLTDLCDDALRDNAEQGAEIERLRAREARWRSVIGELPRMERIEVLDAMGVEEGSGS